MINVFELKDWFKFEISFNDLCNFLFQKGVEQINSIGLESLVVVKIKPGAYFDNIKKIEELRKHLELWYGYSLDVKYK